MHVALGCLGLQALALLQQEGRKAELQMPETAAVVLTAARSCSLEGSCCHAVAPLLLLLLLLLLNPECLQLHER
jgi:hypothetical protein